MIYFLSLIQMLAYFCVFWIVIFIVAIFIKDIEKRKAPILAISLIYAGIALVGNENIFYALMSVALGSMFYYLLIIRKRSKIQQ